MQAVVSIRELFCTYKTQDKSMHQSHVTLILLSSQTPHNIQTTQVIVKHLFSTVMWISCGLVME